jgi:hypothetical protein
MGERWSRWNCPLKLEQEQEQAEYTHTEAAAICTQLRMISDVGN